MKIGSHKLFIRILSIVLAVVMLSVLVINVFAEDSAVKLYVKDVKLIYAKNFDEAKNQLPEGYQLIDKNIDEGTGADYKVYFAYSTTTDENEAATDIKMMNMKGGFVLSDYEEQLKDVKDSVRNLANDVRLAVEMFKQNYVKGTYGAKAAYRALAAFSIDEEGKDNFADFLIYGEPDDEFYIKFVLNAHQTVLSAVLSALAMAVQGEVGNTWLDRLTEIDDPGSIDEEPNYWDDAGILWEHFYAFYDVYKTINHAAYDGKPPVEEEKDENGNPIKNTSDIQPDIKNNGTEAFYEVAYRTLKEYKFKSGKVFADWFLSPEVFAAGGELVENFYCMLEVMTEEELAMMRLCGPLYMILATAMDDTAYKDYVKKIDEVTKNSGTCSIWAGVNSELFRSSIGITDKAARKIAETEFEKGLNNEGDGLGATGLKTAGLVAACGAVSLGIGLATYFGFGSLMLTCFSGTGLTAAASAVAIGGTIFGATLITAGIAAVVIAIVVAIVFLVVWIYEIYQEKHPEYTDIPEFMYDYVEDGSGNKQFILYEGVRFQDGRVADVNNWEGKEWHAMYVSHDKAAGAPIEADINIRYADGHIDKDFAGLSNFGYINAQNLNTYDFDDDVEGVFITYRQADLDGDYARQDYLSDVRLFSDENPDKCIEEIKNKGYTRYEVNLTPNADHVTYLGYKTTNDEDSALTDIRLAYGYNSTQYTTGGNKASYGASGSTADGMLTLYVTSISMFGSPIRSDFLVLGDRNAPLGYEPVNFFTGGPAVNLNLKDDGEYSAEEKPFYLYFLPSETYTSGTEYLGGIGIIYDQTKKSDSGNAASSEKCGYKIFYTTKGKDNNEGYLAYTVTYNPYRALYGMSGVSTGGEMGEIFAQTLFYDGVGYSLVNRFIVKSDGKLSYEYDTDSTPDYRLYTAGIYNGGTPMTVSDLYASADPTVIPDGFYPIQARLSDDKTPINLAHPSTFSFSPFYLFVRGEGYQQGKYITKLFITSKEEILSGSDAGIDCDDLDKAYVMNNLSSMGAHTAILKNLNLKDSDNATYIGYTKEVKKADSVAIIRPITNIVLYYAGKTDARAEEKMIFDEISYERAGLVNIFCEEDGTNSVCKRVYLYYTTNPAAGSPITDIMIDNTIIQDGWQTVRTQNGNALYSDMGEYSGSMWFIHMKRTGEVPKYISEIVVGIGGNEASAKAALLNAGCDYMLTKDLNDNVGILSNYIYLGYKRTSNPDEAIRDLRTTHNKKVDSFERNGITYYKIDGNLNSFTSYFADDIFLYYTKDEGAGTPITSLGTSGSVANWTHGEGGRYVVKTVLKQDDKPSDLNDGAAGDYIYLLQTRDRQDEKGIASMIGGGSLAVIIAFTVLSVVAVGTIYVIRKRRNKKLTVSTDTTSEAEEG